MGQLAFHAVKIGLADTCRQAEDGGLQRTAHTVACAACGADGRFHRLFGLLVQQGEAIAPAQQRFGLRPQCRRVIQHKGGVCNARAPPDVGHDVDAGPVEGTQHHRTACHQRRRDAAGKVSAAPRILKAVVFGVGCVIRMAGAEQVGGLGIVAAAGVLVLDHQGDGGAGRPAVHNAGEELHPVRLHAGGGQAVAPRPALVHAGGEEGIIHRHTRRHAVQHGADGAAMALAEDGQGEGRPERVLHGHSSMPSRGRRPSTGMVSARQQPRPGTLMMVI